MFSCLLLAAISAAPETRDAGVTYKYGECDGCVNYAKLKEQLLLGDAIDRAVTITLYADIEFAEDLKLKSNLVFEPDDPKNTRVVHWIFGSADMDLMNSGSVTFEKVKVSPVVAPGSTTATLYGKSVTINGDLIIPDGISSLKGKFESIKSNTNAILSFDEITYTFLEYEITEWPTKNIVFNSRTYPYTGISIKDIDFEIEIRSEHIILKRENSPSITFNAKMNVFSFYGSQTIGMKIDNCDLKIYQTEFNYFIKMKINELKNSNVTLTGQKITAFDLESDINNQDVSNSNVYISTDLPDWTYKFASYIIITKSVRFDYFSIDSQYQDPKHEDIPITIKVNGLDLSATPTIDSKITFETNELSVSCSGTLNANIIVNEKLEIGNTQLTIDKLKIGDNCAIVVSSLGSITVNTLDLKTNPKVFYYRKELDYDTASEIRDIGLEKLKNIFCSNSEIKAPTQVFLDNDNDRASKIYLSKNDIFDIELDGTKKCFGVKYHKIMSPRVTINVGGTEDVDNVQNYNVQSLNSKEWKVQNNMQIEMLTINLKKEIEGEINLDSLVLDGCILSIQGSGLVKTKLAISQNTFNQIYSLSLNNLEIQSTTPITCKLSELVLSSVTLSEQAMNNINYEKVGSVYINEGKMLQYKQILGKIKKLYIEIEQCDEIKFKESAVELKKTGAQPRELYIDQNTGIVFLQIHSAITLTHDAGSKLKNVHIYNHNSKITLGDDWSDVPDLIPIYQVKRFECEIDLSKSPTIKFLFDENNNEDQTISLTSSSNEKINNYLVYNDNSKSNDEKFMDIGIKVELSESNKISEIKLNDIDYKTQIKITGNENVQILVDNIEIPKTSNKNIQETMDYYNQFYPNAYSDDIMRAIIQAQEASNLEINYVKKLTISSSTNLAIETADSKADEIEFKIYAESVMPVANIRIKNANETQFSFTSVWPDVEINDFSKRFLNKEFSVATILTKRCEDLKPFIINNGKAPITVRCANEDTGSDYYFDNAVIYAKIEYNEESQKLSGGEIAGIVVGSIAGVAIIVVIILFATGVIACSKKEASSEGVNERGAAEV